MFEKNLNAPRPTVSKDAQAPRSYRVFDPKTVETNSDRCQLCECVFCHAK